MTGKEIKHRAKHRRIAKTGAQGSAVQSGQRKQAVCSLLVGQDPAQCAERQGRGVLRRGFGFA